ncbi:MAG TPA: hypothetical protein H9786_14965 [Candidatus Brachybacterium merdavium]|uniref:Phosphotyrosine protein phosphatase I domain-containing protein n=1 Tax=Candidatus Brachybacterium merdavium TaxID=2838513 RepID=A0A9D2RQC3_9MICO|nr:hypothetical protein [Candidatus Brachybacterium merdavium]
MKAADILVVCTANICRSPVGAAMLQNAVAGSGILVGSTGTHAVTGRRPVPEAVEYVHRRTGVVLQGEGTQLTRRRAEAAGLILTMSEAQRTFVAQCAPSSLRRVFTLRQFVRIVPWLPEGATFPSVVAIAEAAARCRALIGPDMVIGDDIEDPYGAAPEVYQRSFSIIEDAVSLTAAVLLSRVRPRSEQ